MPEFQDIHHKDPKDAFKTEVETGTFDRESEAELLARRPDLAEGKRIVSAQIAQALGEMEAAFDIHDALRRLPVGSAVEWGGHFFLKDPKGEPYRTVSWVANYIKTLEKSAIGLSRKVREEENKRLNMTYKEFIQLKFNKVKTDIKWWKYSLTNKIKRLFK